MRFRVSAAVVTGAVALTGLAAPAVHADEKPGSGPAAFAVPASGDESYGNTKISNIVLNGGKSMVLGTSAKKKFTVTFTAGDNSGIVEAHTAIWRGSDFAEPTDFVDSDQQGVSCGTGTTVTCELSITLDPRKQSNAKAGAWKFAVGAVAKDGNYLIKPKVKSVNLQRAAKLTVNAAPEPVKKGKTLTVTGALTRANWDTDRYAGYTGQAVKLQFKKKGAASYTTVKTVKTDKKGHLKTTVKAGSDGTYRYSFAGNSTTQGISSTGDFVDVR
ncbi:hypothetical protein [Streptomyces sp. NPDC001985]|uniref:hypothetical protein n=1 Tax=Streptomyces sp. NPDC001985 TaxID=3154406 RepID=UPI00331CDC4B